MLISIIVFILSKSIKAILILIKMLLKIVITPITIFKAKKGSK